MLNSAQSKLSMACSLCSTHEAVAIWPFCTALVMSALYARLVMSTLLIISLNMVCEGTSEVCESLITACSAFDDSMDCLCRSSSRSLIFSLLMFRTQCKFSFTYRSDMRSFLTYTGDSKSLLRFSETGMEMRLCSSLVLFLKLPCRNLLVS